MWIKVHDHLNHTIQTYKELGTKPGTNTTFALEKVFYPLRKRFEDDERTRRLYEEMLETE